MVKRQFKYVVVAMVVSLNCTRPSSAQDDEGRLGDSNLLAPTEASVSKTKEGDERKANKEQEAAQKDQYGAMLQNFEKQMLEHRTKQLGQQHALAEDLYRRAAEAQQAYSRALAEYANAARKQGHPQLEIQRKLLETQLNQVEASRAELAREMAQLQAAEMAARQQRQQEAALSEDATTKIYSLRHSRAPETARVLSEILSGRALRMAVDDRTNSLIVFANKDTSDVVEALVMKLDQPAGAIAENPHPGETLQLRMIWLLDIDEGMEPTEKLVSPKVVEALHELGFSSPKVVCQQVTTLTLSDDGGRRGHFNFDVPVLVKSHQWQLEGQGQIESMADKRFNVQFDMRFHYGDNHRGQLGGSIYTPLGHYTVMGTTTFVRTDWSADRDVQQPPPERQHLSAFVVYLDRAREFPTTQAPSSNRTDVRR